MNQVKNGPLGNDNWLKIANLHMSRHGGSFKCGFVIHFRTPLKRSFFIHNRN